IFSSNWFLNKPGFILFGPLVCVCGGGGFPPTTSTSSLINSFGLRESYIALSNGVTNGDGEPLKSFSWNIRRNW
ncbi:MAG: hypothetical protein ACK47L_12590, partial [Pseudanabaena sp.]